MRIRRAVEEDLADIVRIENICFPGDTAFPPGMFRYLIKYAVTLVAEKDDTSCGTADGTDCGIPEGISGFAIGYVSGNLGMIYTLDVPPKQRRRGLGTALMKALEGELKALGARRLKLEVASDNPGARELYRRMGFRPSARMISYYGPGRDAIRMTKAL